ncbi:glycosyltransferase family 2 protein [Candidatus Woesearchaeota archaeon]|nr:glycosyltransferase family 2 protein [Candidatus Woesearchaeota archaeon]
MFRTINYFRRQKKHLVTVVFLSKRFLNKCFLMQQMNKKQPKILVGCPTHDGQTHCIQRFLTELKQLTYTNYEVLFVDNSMDENYAKLIASHGYEVLRNPSKNEHRIIDIISNRNIIIKRMLEKKYDYLFFADTDVLLPPDAIEKLLSIDQPIASGVYLGGQKFPDGTKIAPVLYELTDKEDYLKSVPINDVMEDLVYEVAASGMGCLLIRKEVLEKVKLRYSEKIMSGEDILFCHDARKLGYRTFVNTAVRCTHMVPEGDITFPAGIANFSFQYDIE